MNIIVEGIDRIGKDTLISNLTTGKELKVHCGKPPYPEYQYHFFSNEMTKAIFNYRELGLSTLFNRFHIGEMVYGKLYRNMNTDWVLPCIETDLFIDCTKLILLYTTNFELRKDDKKSFDFNNAKTEQNLFMDAIDKSSLRSIKICVNDFNGNWRKPYDIFNEAMKFIDK